MYRLAKFAAGLLIPALAVATSIGATDEPSVRDVIAKFQNSDPGWKVRMESLVRIARMGSAAVPTLTERLKNGSPAVREFSAHALAVLADASSRPALIAALADESSDVRVYAIRALSALDPTPAAAEQFERLAKKDSSWTVRFSAAWALERDDPDAAAKVREALAAYDLSQIDTARLDDAAPDFSLTDPFGKTHRLRDFRGKKSVILKFYQEPL